MAKISPIKAAPTALSCLQQTFCLIKLAGEIFVLETGQITPNSAIAGTSELQFFRLGTARLLMLRYLETQPFTDKPSDVIDDFMVSPNTKVYDSIAFSPLPTPPMTLNLWRDCTINPIPGDWSFIRQYLLEVVCAGDMGAYRYLILFLAHMMQKPEDKPGIMIVMLGGQGIGKGGFFRLLSAIWQQTTLLVSDINHVLGQFNAQVELSYVLCMDEALFVGDKRTTDRFKSFVTEPSITIEQKYQPRRTITSYHRLFAASNHAHFAQVDTDDRRFVFLRVSESRKGDVAYWDQFHKAVADPAIMAAMVHDLKNYDISDFKPRMRPKTEAHSDQKVRSLSGFDRFWNEVLQVGMIDYGDPIAGPLLLDGDTFISTQRLMGAWQSYERQGGYRFSAPQSRDMHAALARLCPSAKQNRKVDRGCQQRGYNLPPLPLARAEFSDFLGGEVQWSD
jgi:hypothetical protein